MKLDNNLESSSKDVVFQVAIIGGGITGSCAAHVLLNDSNYPDNNNNDKNNIHNYSDKNPQVIVKSGGGVVCVDLFDQGRRGVGGRSSDRQVPYSDDGSNSNFVMRWDHGCQFFRADTKRFQTMVNGWISKDIVQEWIGDFRTTRHGDVDGSTTTTTKAEQEHPDFFGLPSLPPFYIGVNGMQSISKGILDNLSSSSTKTNRLSVMTGTRVSHMERDETLRTWRLYGTTGSAAFHDTPEQQQQQQQQPQLLGKGYHVVLLTDVSSSFGKWHRASAGVPESFAKRVRQRVGSRVPLFTAMIAFDQTNHKNNGHQMSPPFDAATFHNDETLWFAAKTNSKLPTSSKPNRDKMLECWTLVSTPEYAMKQIEQTPMQDPNTGEFIPQSKDYLTTVPAPDLIHAFIKQLTSPDGILAQNHLLSSSLPKVIYLDAQRWGSALPSNKQSQTTNTNTTKIISGVPYESIISPLAPTQQQRHLTTQQNFLVDEQMMIVQAGDMMSSLTPGFEAAALSGMDAADYILQHLMPCHLSSSK